jgi:LacI family transcriptional regulator
MTLPPFAGDPPAAGAAGAAGAARAAGGIGSPTMIDVAHHAGVSPMTVSRALRDDPRVSPETKTRVMGAVNALGYRRNEAARNLRLGRASGLIGLVVTNLANPFYSQLALGVEAMAGENGTRVMLGNSGADVARERQLVHDFASRRLDGIIVVPAGSDHRHLRPAQLAGTPVVLAASPPIRFEADAVLLDDFGGSWDATQHLIEAGHRKIAFLGLQASAWTGSERFRGYCAALEDAGIPLDDRIISRQQRDVGAAERAMLELLDIEDPPTAVFTANNRNTIGAYRAIRACRPDVALAGFDDFELADMLSLPLTVISYDPRELGRRAAELIRDRIRNPQAQHAARRIVLPTRLVEYGQA